jgi:type IV secretory pathway TrbD component
MASEEEQDVLTPVRVSLLKDDLVAGCERMPAVATGAFAMLCIVIIHTYITFVIGLLAVIAAFPILRYVAKRDPQFFLVMTRYFKYQGEYEAQTSVTRIPPPVRSWT